MRTNIGIGVPEYTNGEDGHVRQIHDKIEESSHVVAYLNGLDQTQEYFHSRNALSNVEKVIGENMKHWTNPFADDFTNCFNRGGMVGIDIATTMLNAASTTKISDCIEWAANRILFESTVGSEEGNKSKMTEKLLEYGQMSEDDYAENYLKLPIEISEAIIMGYADSGNDNQVDEMYIELGMGFVLNAVREYADVWDYLETDKGDGRRDKDYNRMLYNS